MTLLSILALTFILFGILAILLLRQNLRLKRKNTRLEKEVDIQNSKLNYQKEQFSDSANYFYSSEVIIMEMLQEIDVALKSEEGDLPEKILQIIFEKTKSLFKPKRCILFKIDAKESRCSYLYSCGYEDAQLRKLNLSLDANKSFLGWSAQTGKFLSYDDAQKDSLLSHLIEIDPLRCHYSQPLKAENQVKAILCVGSVLQEIERDAIVRLFSILSNITSVALSNALLTQELRELSARDSLTGLYNHSYFQKWLEISLNRLAEKNPFLSLAMVDLDHFKSINDAYGHQTGDIILKTISGLLNNLKTSDYICARYGGEELALAFKAKDAEQTRSIMEDVRKKISQQAFEMQDKGIRITISIGIAEAQFFQAKKVDKQDLIKSADEALYRAKAEGRNKVVVA